MLYLPDTLEKMLLDWNEFEGNLDLSSLPPSLQYLRVNNNILSGSVVLSYLPPSMTRLY